MQAPGSSGSGFGDIFGRIHRKKSQRSGSSLDQTLERLKIDPAQFRELSGKKSDATTPTELSSDWAALPSLQSTPDTTGRHPTTIVATPSTTGSAASFKSPFTPRSTAGSVASSRRNVFCGYCDMPAEFTLKNEAIVDLECGHSAHLHCYKQLSIVSKEPPCGICDMPGKLKAADSQPARPDTPSDTGRLFGGLTLGSPSTMSSLHAIDLASRRSSSAGASLSSVDENIAADYTGPPPMEINRRSSVPSINRVSSRPSSSYSSASETEQQRQIPRPAFASKWHGKSPLSPLSPDALGPSLLDELRISAPPPRSGGSTDSTCSILPLASANSDLELLEHPSTPLPRMLSLSPNSQTVTPQHCAPLTVGLISETERVPLDAKTFRLLLSVSSTGTKDSQSPLPYRQTVADVQHALKVIEYIGTLYFRGMPLSSLRTGALRLHSTVELYLPRGLEPQWRETECLLFQNYLLMIRQGVVKGVLDVTSQVEAAAFVNLASKPGRCLRLVISGAEVPDTILWSEDDELLQRWSLALHDSTAEFPLELPSNPENAQARALNANISPPVYLVLCLPLPRTEKLAAIFGETISSVRRRLNTFDKLGIVYVEGTHQVGLQRSSWEGWESEVKQLQDLVKGVASNPPRTDPIRTLNDALALYPQESSAAKSSGEPGEPRKVILYVNNKDTSTNAPTALGRLKAVPTILSDTGISVHCIGLGETHDLAVTSTIAGHSRGSYNYVREDKDLPKLARRLVRFEQNTTHRDVQLVVKPRVGMRIISVGGDASPPFNTASAFSLASAPISPASSAAVGTTVAASHGSRLMASATLDEKGTLLWPIGWLHENEAHSILVEVSVDDSRSVAQAGVRSILHVGVQAINPTCPPGSKSEPARMNTRMPVTFGDNDSLSPLVAAKFTGVSTALVFETVARFLAAGQLRQAFQCLNAMQVDIAAMSVQVAGSYPEEQTTHSHAERRAASEYFESLTLLYDEFCETILENKPLMRDLFLRIFQHIWLMRTECAILPRTRLEKLFRAPI